jgi:hypothetical protein
MVNGSTGEEIHVCVCVCVWERERVLAAHTHTDTKDRTHDNKYFFCQSGTEMPDLVEIIIYCSSENIL